MRRFSALLALLLVALFAAAQPALAAGPAAPDHARVTISLKASDGLSARLENDDDRVTLTVTGHRQYVSYDVRGEVSSEGVEARFGELGEISVGFRPTRTLESTGPFSGCQGEPWTTKRGLFTGTIRFQGERGYVEVESTRARGTMELTPEWKCREGRRPGPAAAASRDFEADEEGDVATLTASLADPRRLFGAFAIRDPLHRDYTLFSAAAVEPGEGMRIVRGAYATSRSPAFLFDHERGTAAISPPAPFRGGASFRRDPHGRDIWGGTLRVPLLGADTVALTGPRFEAGLRRDFPGD
jgi:hypothetical protein